MKLKNRVYYDIIFFIKLNTESVIVDILEIKRDMEIISSKIQEIRGHL